MQEKRDTDTIYVGDPRACRRCTTVIGEYYLEDPENSTRIVLCKRCKLELNPPELKYTKSHSCGLWNVTQRRYENYLAVKELAACGWFLRQRIITGLGPRMVPRGGTEQLLYEYFGKTTCARVPNHEYYYSEMPRCVTSTCK